MQQATGVAPSKLDFADLDATVIGGFLDHLERDRGLSARSRNVRLAAIRSLFSFAALRHPEHAALIGRVLAIPVGTSSRTVRRWPCAGPMFQDRPRLSVVIWWFGSSIGNSQRSAVAVGGQTSVAAVT